MFRTKGDGKEGRAYHHNLIEDVASLDVGAGIVLGSIYFEWAIRRAIVALGKSSVSELNAKFKAGHNLGYEDLKRLWKEEVAGRDGISGLTDVFDLNPKKPVFGKLKLTGRDIDRARTRRNEIVHGGRCSPLPKNGFDYVMLQIAAAEALADLVERRSGRSIYSPIRRKTK